MELYTEEYVYQVILSAEDLDKIYGDMPDAPFTCPIYQWCEEQFGMDNRWYNTFSEWSNSETFCFKREEDRTFFVLKWSV
jgi:hypothetical protein